MGIKRGVCGKIFEFFFYGCKDVGFDGVCIDVKGLSGEMIVFVEIYFEFDGFFWCWFVFVESGVYMIFIKYVGKEIFSGLFKVMMYENVVDV